MVKVTIVDPNITDEENEKRLKRIYEVLDCIAQEIRESEDTDQT